MRASNAKNLRILFRFGTKAYYSISSEISELALRDQSALASLRLKPASDSGESPKRLPGELSSLLHDSSLVKKADPAKTDDVENMERIQDIPWLTNSVYGHISKGRNRVSREKKQKWVFKSSQSNRFAKLVKMCADKLGTDTTLEVFGKLGRETSVKEYNALIEICIDKARETNDEDVAIEQVSKIFHLFESMKEKDFELEEETYGPLLMYLIDMGMIDEFHYFCEVIKDKNPNSVSKLGYYEMKLWLGVDNEEKIQELCDYVAVNNGEDTSDLRENYLLALCESDRKKELLELLEIINITKLSSAKYVENIFRSLGRLLLESVTEKLLLAFKTCGHEEDSISNFISIYAVSIPNLVVEDIISKFKDLHQRLDVSPSSLSYERLILYSCDLHKVSVALDIVDEMCEGGSSLSTKLLRTILRVIEETCDYNLVHRIYSMIYRHDLNPNVETLRWMINICVEMKDFEGAYKMIKDLEGRNAYASGGQLEKGKQGVSNPSILVKNSIEIKSALVSTLASHGQFSEAFHIYEEIKQAGHNVEPRAVISLIENTQSDEQLDRLLQLLQELRDPDYWLDGCCRIILYCIRNKNLSSAVDLSKQLKDKFNDDELVMEALFDKVFSLISTSESSQLQIGLDLLTVMKDDHGLKPSQKCADFFQSACSSSSV
ncbi:hypothetical protein L6164_018572 [Bauhinia variegata]|uniref:Uncharacterized protein n=1 Tax=Bauhinia variegata TaxID=167791 RepID=A0ACB9NF40_BAUVA|nr:hypothetical protein L6164_018572 [Bauhinia variegata]